MSIPNMDQLPIFHREVLLVVVVNLRVVSVTDVQKTVLEKEDEDEEGSLQIQPIGIHVQQWVADYF